MELGMNKYLNPVGSWNEGPYPLYYLSGPQMKFLLIFFIISMLNHLNGLALEWGPRGWRSLEPEDGPRGRNVQGSQAKKRPLPNEVPPTLRMQSHAGLFPYQNSWASPKARNSDCSETPRI